MKTVTLTVGAFDTNCYLVFDEKRRVLYVIDPGADAPEIIRTARRFDFERAEVLLTHSHFDHIGALKEVVAGLGATRVFLAKPDLFVYQSRLNSFEPYFPLQEDLPRTSDAQLPDDPFRVLPLPGHTPGGSGFLFDELPALFAGDTIFAGSVGRTDLPGGDTRTLLNSIRGQILPLPDDLKIYSGHGPATTVGRERSSNPYL